MYVSRGDISPEPVSQNRSREAERVQSVHDAPRRQAPTEPQPALDDLNEVRRISLLAQRTLARAQSVLGALEGFRVFLGSAGDPQAERKASEYILASCYLGEAVLEPHREELLRLLARGDEALLERMVNSARQNLASLAAARPGSPPPQEAPVALAALADLILRTGGPEHQLQSGNVLKLLS